jgi:hypothetical protein
MRSFLVSCLLAGAVATPALAQPADRYGGVSTYGAPQQQQGAPAPPARVLSWPGKAVPAAAPPQANGYGYPRYTQAQPAYAQGRGAPPPPYAVQRRAAMYPTAPAPQGYAPQGYAPQGYAPPQAYAPQAYAPQPQAQVQQQQMAPQALPFPAQPMSPQAYSQQMPPPQQMRAPASYPSGLQAQPYYAPAPGAPAPAPGSTATAPNGVYPANTVPPQLAYPMTVPPQMAAPLVGQPQQQPTSIYAPQQGAMAPQATAREPELNGSSGLSGQAVPNPTDPRQPQMVAMNTAVPLQSARLYSLHREFGLTPDPTPAPAPQGQTVELVSSIDSGGPNPDGDEPAKTVKKVTNASGKITAQLRGNYASDN